MRKLSVILVTALLAFVSCVKEPLDFTETRRVMIMVSAGFNSLSGELKEDLGDIENGYLPTGNGRFSDALVVLSRFPASPGDYLSESEPVLYRIWKDADGNLQKETLKTWSGATPLSSKATLEEALTYIKDNITAKSYGMVFSSHGTGWLPEHYYSDPKKYENTHTVTPQSIGQDVDGGKGKEIEIQDFADAIPMKMDYILMDACLMGGVEVAYQLKDKADYVGFSQTEILSNGFNYNTLVERLLGNETPDPEAVCRDYFEQYETATYNRCATVSLIKTGAMDALVQVCRELFEKYRSTLNSMGDYGIQEYFRYDRHYFYDLEDILVHAEITADEQERLEDALSQCIVYKAATPTFLEIDIDNFCGLSMYLPSMGTELLNAYYKEHMTWNKATELVK